MCHVLTDQENRGLQNPDSELLTYKHYGYLEKAPYGKKEVITDPSKLLWIDTVFIHFRCNFRQWSTGRYYSSNDVKFSDYRATFEIVFMRAWEDIAVGIDRTFNASNCLPVGKHFLRIFFEIANSLNPGKYTDLTIDKIGAEVKFSVKEFYDFDNACDTVVLKCSIWKYEQLSVSNDASMTQDKNLLAHILGAELPPHATYCDLAYLMDSAEVCDFFTGGESEEFSNQKLLLLKRTSAFSAELARRSRCIRENIPFENATPVSLILGHIYNGMSHDIQRLECLELLKISCKYGLRYLQKECYLFLVHNLDDCDFLVDVMLETSKLEQWTVLDLALDHFVRHKDSVEACDRWIELLTLKPEQFRILDSLRKRKIASVKQNVNL